MNRVLGLLRWVVLLGLILRLWIQPLGSSFWVDEMATVFIVQHPHDASLVAVPQLQHSLYYPLVSVASSFGTSEVIYRIPSLLLSIAMLTALAWLARRLIAPGAEWIAVFACFSLKLMNFTAIDTRPYALGLFVATAAVLCLVRWLDGRHWIHAVLFVVLAAALWRVHLIFWPFYAVFAIYAGARLWLKDTSVRAWQVAAAFVATGLLLLPVLRDALLLMRQAKDHVIIGEPGLRQFAFESKIGLVAACALGAAALHWILKWRGAARPSSSSTLLIGVWWLCQPVALFAFSWLTGNSVFVSRYLAIALPGLALTVAYVIARFVPQPWLPRAALLFGVGVLVFAGNWRHTPVHSPSDWRGAASQVNATATSDTPVLCPSPFIEAKWPVWNPDYPLPGFLYSHLAFYPVRGRVIKLPFTDSPEAQAYVRKVMHDDLLARGEFIIYGSRGGVRYWQHTLAEQPELSHWTAQHLGNFGDVDAVKLTASGAPTSRPTNSK